MRREIKFRAWDKIGKRMGEVNYIKYSNVQYNQVSARFKQNEKTVDEWFAYGDKEGCDNIILMQYTGLKDKKGVEIYEGDILHIEIENWHIKGDIIASGNEVVEYQECCFGVIWGYHRDFIKLNGFTNTTFEVIGNIYSNPELLKEGE